MFNVISCFVSANCVLVQALKETVNKEVDSMRAMAVQVREVLAGMADSMAAQPRALDDLRGAVRQLAEEADTTQKTLSGVLAYTCTLKA